MRSPDSKIRQNQLRARELVMKMADAHGGSGAYKLPDQSKTGRHVQPAIARRKFLGSLGNDIHKLGLRRAKTVIVTPLHAEQDLPRWFADLKAAHGLRKVSKSALKRAISNLLCFAKNRHPAQKLAMNKRKEQYEPSERIALPGS